MKNSVFVLCMFALVCIGCKSWRHSSENIVGDYVLLCDDVSSETALPALKIHKDSTFEYAVPGIGGPYSAFGSWRKTPRGVKLATQFKCIGANVDYVGKCLEEDSVDIVFRFLTSQKSIGQIKIGDRHGIKEIALDGGNHCRLKASTIQNGQYLIDELDYYTLCNQDIVKPGYEYLITIVDNPYYPIINNEEWIVHNDCIITPKKDGKKIVLQKRAE